MEIMNQIKMYVANDGTIFNTYDDCKRHEDNLASLANIETVDAYYNIYNNEYCTDDNIKILWYRPKNISELNTINEYYNINIPNTAINRWVCVHIFNVNSYIDESIIEMCPYDLFSKFTLFDDKVDPTCITCA